MVSCLFFKDEIKWHVFRKSTRVFSEGDSLGTLREEVLVGNRNKYASVKKESKKAWSCMNGNYSAIFTINRIVWNMNADQP